MKGFAMHVGFTGTRRGMSIMQQVVLRGILDHLNPESQMVFHHGRCEGADVQAASLAKRCLARAITVGHPGPLDDGHQVLDWVDDELREPKSHFARNRDIVNESAIVIATPWQTEAPPAKTGGGTWYTIEYAKKQAKPLVIIIWPNGAHDRLTLDTSSLLDSMPDTMNRPRDASNAH